MGTSKKRGNGEGTIFKREINGKTMWVTEYTIAMYDNKTGKRKRKTIYGKTRQEVKTKLEKVITELNTNTYVDKSKVTFYSIAKEFIDNGYKMNKLKESSYSRKLHTLKNISSHYMANMELQKITENDLKDFFVYITKYSDSVIAKIYGIVNNTFKIAVRRNILRYNFLDDQLEFEIPVSNKFTNKSKSVSAFTIEEQKQLIEVLQNTKKFRYKYQIYLSLYTGMRMGEINALDVNDIDFENKIIHIRRTITRTFDDRATIGSYTKTVNGIRDLLMDPFVENLLKEYLASEYYTENDYNLLFCNSYKQCISTDTVNMMFKYFCKENNISKGYDVHQHMLRHTFATRCIEAGMPASVLARIMGHANVATTLNVYCEVFDKFKKEHLDMSFEYLKKQGLTIDFK